jgi:hypothetical protein
MGLLQELIARSNHGTAAEAGTLRDILSIMGTVDGKLDDAERAAIAGLYRTLPQLKAMPEPQAAPPRANRARLLEELRQIEDERFRRQCFVVAVEVALSSGGANDSEDQYVEHLRAALRIDEPFARRVIEVLAYKYACNA